MFLTDVQNLMRCTRDPWYFLTHYVRTLDPARGVLPYPDYPYLRDLVAVAEAHRFLLVPKSRQMLVTWTMVAYTLWRALFRGPGLYVFLSRNERCAEELLERARFILAQLPPHLRPRPRTNSREELAFAALGARILSLPATPDAPRMYSPSGVFWDEMAFTPFDEQIWGALKPALDSGGRFVGVSSAGGALNLFARSVRTESPSVYGGTEGGCVSAAQLTPLYPPASRGEQKSPPVHGGMKAEFAESSSSSLLVPRSSLFHVHRIHYSQHPERQSDEWKSLAGRGLSAARWQQEQEISFDAQDDLVYGEFTPALHVLDADWTPRSEWELYRTLDFGYRHPFVLWLQRTPDGDLIVFDEWTEADRTTAELLAALRGIDRAHGLDEADVLWSACDPAGAAAQDAGLSPVDVLRRAGIKLRYRSSRITAGIEQVKAALRDTRGRSSLRISPRCRRLIADFRRYRWAAGRDEPHKDGVCDHSMDALRYFFVNFETAEDLPPVPRLAAAGR